jgi:ABC-type glutathione transport system ATPase component
MAAQQQHQQRAASQAAPIGVSLRSLSLYVQRGSPPSGDPGGGGGGSASRHELCLLRNITGVVPPGSLFLIYGGSGSGKTSLMNALAGRLGAAGYRLTGACAWRQLWPAVPCAWSQRTGHCTVARPVLYMCDC